MRQLRTLAMGYPDGMVVDAHAHDWDQLVYAAEGALTVRTADATWLLPPHRAVWMPAGVEHTLKCVGLVSLRTLYFELGAVADRGRCRVVEVTPLLRELVLHCAAIGARAGLLDGEQPEHRHLIDVVLDQLRELPTSPLELPMPQEPRARKLADALVAEVDADLEDACRRAGATRRTLERAFRKELGLSLGQWRTQLRLLGAARQLVAGNNVTEAALAAGYDSTSAFITAFKRAFGDTPARYALKERAA
jgi:AraC-like DNA-binding protein